MKIKEIIHNTKTGNIYIKTIDNNKQRSLLKDNISYYVIIDKKIGLIYRFVDIDNINKINKFIGD